MGPAQGGERPGDDARERAWLLRQLTDETVGGLLLLGAAVVALVWANSRWSAAYFDLVSYSIGPPGLQLTLGEWASSGLLTVFFLVVGLELKHEFVLGSLSRVRYAVVPVVAAVAGMAVPALVYAGVNLFASNGQPAGWAIPMATDIAFALAVLAVVGRRLPLELRAFLLTLAVVDDLGGITVIALGYSDGISIGWLAAASAAVAVYAVAQRLRVRTFVVYVPLVLLGWYCMEHSGVHATIAGVLFGLCTRVRPDPGEPRSPALTADRWLHPISASLCVPIFALLSAGVSLRGIGLLDALTTPIAVGVILGLVVGKPLGIVAGTWLTARFTRAGLPPGLGARDVLAVGILGGIGFTVALLIAQLALVDQAQLNSAKVGVLSASVVSALVAASVLVLRGIHGQRAR